jgi:hypothetical protein
VTVAMTSDGDSDNDSGNEK